MLNCGGTPILLLLSILVLSGCSGSNSGEAPDASVALKMVEKHYREVINKEAIKFEEGGDGELLKQEWSNKLNRKVDVYALPAWVHIKGDLPGQVLRLKVATNWRKLDVWTYKNIGIYVVNGTEEVNPPDMIPTPPTPPQTAEALRPLIQAFLEKKFPKKSNTPGDYTRMGLKLDQITVKEKAKWLGPDKDFSYDTMRFTVPLQYSYELVLMERRKNKPTQYKRTVNVEAFLSDHKPNGADWLKDNTVKKWKYLENHDKRKVDEKVTEVEVEVPELDLTRIEKDLRGYINAKGTHIKSMSLRDKKTLVRKERFRWRYWFDVRYVNPHWNKKDAIEYQGTAYLEVDSPDMGKTWEYDKARRKLSQDKQIKFHSGGMKTGLRNL